jgi:hypothetical protein
VGCDIDISKNVGKFQVGSLSINHENDENTTNKEQITLTMSRNTQHVKEHHVFLKRV